VADYLQSYAAEFRLPVRLNTEVTSLTRTDGVYVAETGGDPITARQVVLATGPFQVPYIPPVSAQLHPEVIELHSNGYRRPDGFPLGRVLVAWIELPRSPGLVDACPRDAAYLAQQIIAVTPGHNPAMRAGEVS
jgi:hypothetical protein